VIADINNQSKQRRPFAARSGEQGYVLIVFLLLAALLLVGLSTIIPNAVFEGRREKEAELVFRGMQYYRAIRLYYHKFGRYPTSMDDLTKTNNLRFLRKRYKDPMTKDGDWRIIHVAANGAFVDSLTASIQATSLTSGQGSSGSTSTQPGANPGSTQQTSTSSSGFQSAFGQSSGQPALGLSPVTSGTGAPATTPGLSGQPGAPGSEATNPALSPSANPGAIPVFQAGTTGQGQGQGQGQTQTQGQGQQNPGDASSSNPQTIGSTQPVTTGSQQTFGAGSIAGFASLSKQTSIRKWNGYTEYDKWEFIYDFRQDSMAGGAAAAPANQAAGQQQQQQQPQPGTPPSPGFQPFQPGFPSTPAAPGGSQSPFSLTPGAQPPPPTR